MRDSFEQWIMEIFEITEEDAAKFEAYLESSGYTQAKRDAHELEVAFLAWADLVMERLHQAAVARPCENCGTGAGEPTCECSQAAGDANSVQDGR